jgi:hypothetical protein
MRRTRSSSLNTLTPEDTPEVTSCVGAKSHPANHAVRDADRAAHRQRRKRHKAGREAVLPGHGAASQPGSRPRQAMPAVPSWAVAPDPNWCMAFPCSCVAAVFALDAGLTISNYACDLWS